VYKVPLPPVGLFVPLHGLVMAVFSPRYGQQYTLLCFHCMCVFVSSKGTDATPWLGSTPVCFARAAQCLVAVWLVFPASRKEILSPLLDHKTLMLLLQARCPNSTPSVL
jgi:hypothetical protein